ncbi:MAG: acyltransferase [Clostridium sp.]|nr:acyltransferase [Clostridium sp.]
MNTNRNHILDYLKGLAIIAVVLYHWGLCKYGYLGVDIFLAISGYLVAKGIIKSFGNSDFSYWTYINKRLARLWPGLILISIISLLFGWRWMLPLHFKLDCEAALGTVLFSNNFVQYITSGNYWMADNEYKPLMHTWYIGVLMQFYLIIPFAFMIAFRISKHWLKSSYCIISGLFTISILLYASPLLTLSQNFYLLPSRFFELSIGCMIAIIESNTKKNNNNLAIISLIPLIVLTLILLLDIDINEIKLRLLILVFVTAIMISCSYFFKISIYVQKMLAPLGFLGMASYSLYLCHQVFFAMYRYAVDNEFSTLEHILILFVTLLMGIILYYIFEKPLGAYMSKQSSNIYKINALCLTLAVPIIVMSGYYYKKDGLVRDIPELNLYIDADNITPEDYNSRIFSFDRDFENNARPNILVIGDSFGRDWINVLIECGIDSLTNISYHTEPDEVTIERMEQADYIFVANNGLIFDKYDKILPALMKKGFYRVGLKEFGSWAGLVYSNRNNPDYFNQIAIISQRVTETQNIERAMFDDHYIDMLSPVRVDNNNIKLFTENKMMISRI